MTMLKTFDLHGNKQSFASWISNLSPCETPFISMIPKESVDQVQYSWQTDALAAAKNDGVKEGAAFESDTVKSTIVHTNFTKIFRKGVRVSDTTKQIGLWGRGSELAYQMEKAGMEIKRDVEHYLLNNTDHGQIGTASVASECDGIQRLVAPVNSADIDTGAVVHKMYKYKADEVQFTKEAVFDLTYNLYLAGARANKIMVHPMHVHIFSDFIADAQVTGAKPKAPHLHRMFDGLDSKYNVFVKKIRDPLGQEFEIIPNRFMPTHQLFFFNEKDWTQMVLRAPEKTELGRTGSTQKFMIEMEVGLRHKNPYASGILDFVLENKTIARGLKAKPGAILADDTTTSDLSVDVIKQDGTAGVDADKVVWHTTAVNDDGTSDQPTITEGTVVNGKSKATIKHSKGARVKVRAVVKDGTHLTDSSAEIGVDTYESRA